jgi:anti-sigma regulatory factor (Ser/Thr protein kinase)
MHLSKDLPARCDCDLPVRGADVTSDVLIPIRRLRSPQDGERLEEELSALYEAHFTGGLAKLAAPFTTTVSELCDNATTHGRSKLGVAYVAARRYGQKRCVLVIGDLGIGVPAHIRNAHPQLTKDDDAIREATKEGMTGTGSPRRGVGYQYVIDALKDSKVRKGELRLWSGNGRFRLNAAEGVQTRRQAWGVENPTAGTWIRLELRS